MHLAYFITPHGFGHAARACAVMIALQKIESSIHFDIFTTIPEWFFHESGIVSFTYHKIVTDIGLIQHNAFEEDLEETSKALHRFIPFSRDLVSGLAEHLQQLGTRLVLCDIAPLGLSIAAQAKIPSVLIENFTWDWIYNGYTVNDQQWPQMIHYLHEQFQKATCHIQTRPVCLPVSCDLETEPVSRPTRSPSSIRPRLGISPEEKMILITLGGIEGQMDHFLPPHFPDHWILVFPGAARNCQRDGNILRLPHHHGFFHPDLVSAADVVIGKLGYSTLAECYHTGTPFAFIPRDHFPESVPLTNFVLERMHGIRIDPANFIHGHWIDQLATLVNSPTIKRSAPNGADQIADFILDRFFP
ncbi:UDP-N-acetylglucosamine:LPS N-acetylglucosamine transferase [Anaerolinea thermolimosa]|uniref:hypothetical protein n=1 Tax=Anaerolinea thermolimosa TaxID=229919 RepID=UPI0007809AB2|nr:hypothetical protein [Anaerolinea thermolimosa]GAP06522.1 UDP-N-acetylglucosamine:LPS N-acetylglucosamine transferase [Anaerolinea thermolimosa]